MNDFFKDLSDNVPSVEFDIKSWVESDWQEFHKEKGIDYFGTCKRIIFELGNTLEENDNKLKAYITLMDLYTSATKEGNQEKYEKENELFDFIIRGVLSALKMEDISIKDIIKKSQTIRIKNWSDLNPQELKEHLNIG
ncbi:hypothetical protein [Paenibacillus alginolyticus]|uniref:Uncharacterized protein n=1 Tax=Paenibacillus alginolyticus TaxID=59839 RepID=A0ABT4GK00_9BACL|nr:hypothetical protein [Paenibacillus alginolyticus]MCY9696441.1 hypothetical protein [Paenibacillus alginolyticus]MEC0145276.1 hypothetical protein [Paenibacillus alginolyticus]